MVKSAVRYIQWYIFIRYNWHNPIFTIIPINCPQKRIRVKFRDHSRQNIARLELEVERYYVGSHVEINQDVSSNTNNFCDNLFVIYSNCCPIKEKEISFARLRKPWISDAIMISLNRKEELFRQYKNGTVTFDHYNSFKNNFTTSLRLQKIAISRGNSPSALITLGTRGRL